MKNKISNCVIGVDGGGTKTIALASNLKGKILAKAEGGPSNPRNIGMEGAVFNISEVISRLLKMIKKRKIISTVIALPTIEEEYQGRKDEILNLLESKKKISRIFRARVKIFSDQAATFNSGTNGKDGVVLIAGTGCVAHGWKGGGEVKTSGWGWLADEGSAFWVGQKTFQAILKNLDGRGPETLLTKLALREFKIKDKKNLLKIVYSDNPAKIISKLSIICDKASKKGDKIAKRIMTEAGEELASAAKKVIKKLSFQKMRFPLVLAGSMFKSKIILNTAKRKIRKIAPRIHFIRPKRGAVFGAIKLALEKTPRQ